MLLCEQMLPHEAIVVCGAERFSRHTGYGYGFAWAGPPPAPTATDTVHRGYVGRAPIDVCGRRDTHTVAMDALVCRGYSRAWQYAHEQMQRELCKAYAAFLGDDEELKAAAKDKNTQLRPVSTGNWGCGVFGGDPQLKSLLQWVAAAAAQRDVHYFTFTDKRVKGVKGAQENDLEGLIQAIKAHSKVKCVRDLYNLISDVNGSSDPNGSGVCMGDAKSIIALVKNRLQML
eukprot:GDKI01046607.1.p1 GENE.GDKI01046607.1~~GDKI01046607.1.p1  ORF type:complete len:230 (+),score=79.80 GDKI01046607.1:278-967(+)